MQIRNQRPISRLHGALLAALITVVVFFIALIANRSGSAALESAVRINTSNIHDVQVEGEYIYYLEAGSLHCVNSKGKFKWNTSVDRNSGFKVTGKGIAVWSGSRLRIVDIDTGVVIGNVSTPSEIISAVVGDVYVAVVLSPEHNSTVLLLDHYGNTVDTLTDFKEVTVLTCGFFEGRELFWIMTLDSTGSLPTCRISTFKPGKRETGSITDMEQVIYNVMFRSSYICATGTDYMRVYDYTGAEQVNQRLTVYGWYLEAVDSSSDNPLMLFVPSAQAGENMQINDIRCVKGSDEHLLHFPVVCSQLKCFGNTIYGFAGSQLAVGTYGSSNSTVYALPLYVNDVLGITSSRVAVVTSGGSLYMIQLPEA